MPNIEIEARTVLSLPERESILAYMDTLGEIKKIRRVMIDFSGIDRTRTVVLRVNNGQQSLVTKTGVLQTQYGKSQKYLLIPHRVLSGRWIL
jgi:hypothetical protein